MPVCKNDPDRYYRVGQKSPMGLGYSARLLKLGSRRRGKDGDMYTVKLAGKTKRWVRTNIPKKKKTRSTNSAKPTKPKARTPKRTTTKHDRPRPNKPSRPVTKRARLRGGVERNEDMNRIFDKIRDSCPNPNARKILSMWLTSNLSAPLPVNKTTLAEWDPIVDHTRASDPQIGQTLLCYTLTWLVKHPAEWKRAREFYADLDDEGGGGGGGGGGSATPFANDTLVTIRTATGGQFQLPIKFGERIYESFIRYGAERNDDKMMGAPKKLIWKGNLAWTNERTASREMVRMTWDQLSEQLGTLYASVFVLLYPPS